MELDLKQLPFQFGLSWMYYIKFESLILTTTPILLMSILCFLF